MPTFPRTVKPREIGEIQTPAPLGAVTARGVGQVRAEDRVGGKWTERWPPLKLIDPDVRNLLSTIRRFHRRGTIFDVTHLALPGSGQSPNGTGSSGVQVAGSGQSGTSINTDGWPASTNNVVRAGDWINIGSLNTTFEITADANSDGSGAATLSIEPPILSGSEPNDNDSVTTTGATFRARIESKTMPSGIPASSTITGVMRGLEVTFRLMP